MSSRATCLYRGIQMDDVTVRPMTPEDINEARAVFQLAFGTFVGHPDPARWSEDRDLVGFRWRMDPLGAFVAHADGRLVAEARAAFNSFSAVIPSAESLRVAASRFSISVEARFSTSCRISADLSSASWARRDRRRIVAMIYK